VRSVPAISVREVISALDPYRGMVRSAPRCAKRRSPDLVEEKVDEEPVSLRVVEITKAAVSVQCFERKTIVPIRVRRERKQKQDEETKLFLRRCIKPKPKYPGSEFINSPSLARLMARR
jgi:hypothetical protein